MPDRERDERSSRWRVWRECRAIVNTAHEPGITRVTICHRWRWHRGACR